MAKKCKAKVDIGLEWKKGEERDLDEATATLMQNSGWVDILPAKKDQE